MRVSIVLYPLHTHPITIPSSKSTCMISRADSTWACWIRGQVPESTTVTAENFPSWPKRSGVRKQHSTEYWLMGSLLYNEGKIGEEERREAVRVLDPELADVYYVPFFSSLSFNTHGHVMTDPEMEIDRQLQNIPPWWVWFYYINPIQWTLRGIITSQLGDVQTKVNLGAGVEVPVNEYIESAFGYKPRDVGISAAVLIGVCLSHIKASKTNYHLICCSIGNKDSGKLAVMGSQEPLDYLDYYAATKAQYVHNLQGNRAMDGLIIKERMGVG